MQETFRIYRAEKEDARQIAELAIQMWEDNTVEGLAEEFAGIMEQGGAIFLAEPREAMTEEKVVEPKVIAFAQCQVRHDYVEGTDTSPVGYLEGIFVKEGYREQGCAKNLLAACEKWATEQGCTEFASDCELTNTVSQEFHKKLGFEEANRIVCFVKKLGVSC